VSALRRTRAWLREISTLDLRSLACLRVLTGGVVVWDVLDRARDLTAHYTDGGILPTETARALAAHFGWFSLHTQSGSFGYQLALAIVTLLLGLALVAGLATRLVTPLCWVLCVSVQNRFCLGDYPGDYLLAVMLLGGSLLPWGALGSADAWRRQRRGAALPAPQYRGPGGHALLLLFVLFLGTAGLSKIAAGGHWLDGSALYLTLSSARYTSGRLDGFLDHPGLLQPISYGIPWLEVALPLLLLSPWRHAAVRTWAIAASCALFVSFSVGLDLSAFPLLSGAIAIGLLPPWFWEQLVPALRRRARRAPAPPAAREPAAQDAVTSDRALLPGPAARVTHALAICLMLLHATHYFYKIGNFSYFAAPKAPPAFVDRTLGFLRLKNIYRLFADPSVFEQSDGWDVAPGELADGRKIDVLSGAALSSDPPPSATEALDGLRWHQYLTLLNWYPSWNPKHITSYHVVEYARLRADLARYLCRWWNERHTGAERLASVNVGVVSAPVRYAQPKAAPRMTELLARAHRCAGPAPVAGVDDHAD